MILNRNSKIRITTEYDLDEPTFHAFEHFRQERGLKDYSLATAVLIKEHLMPENRVTESQWNQTEIQRLPQSVRTVLKLARQNPGITAHEMAVQSGITDNQIKGVLAQISRAQNKFNKEYPLDYELIDGKYHYKIKDAYASMIGEITV